MIPLRPHASNDLFGHLPNDRPHRCLLLHTQQKRKVGEPKTDVDAAASTPSSAPDEVRGGSVASDAEKPDTEVDDLVAGYFVILHETMAELARWEEPTANVVRLAIVLYPQGRRGRSFVLTHPAAGAECL